MRALLDNPIVVRDLRARFRGARLPLLLAIFVVVVGLVVIGALALAPRLTGLLAGISPSSAGVVARSAGVVVLWAALIPGALVVCVVTPVVAAASISREIERGTFDLLVASPLSGREVVLGKAVSAALLAVALCLSTMPLAALGVLAGGLSIWRVAAAYAVLALIAFYYASFGVLLSALTRRTVAAVVAVLVLLLLGLARGPVYIGSVMTSVGLFSSSLAAAGGPTLSGLFKLSLAGPKVQALQATSVLGATAALDPAPFYRLSLPALFPSALHIGLTSLLVVALAVHALRGDYRPEPRLIRWVVTVYLFGMGFVVLGSGWGALASACGRLKPEACALLLAAFFGPLSAGLDWYFGPFIATGKAEGAGLPGFLRRGLSREAWARCELPTGFLLLLGWAAGSLPALGLALLLGGSAPPLKCLLGAAGYLAARALFVASLGLLMSLLARGVAAARGFVYLVLVLLELAFLGVFLYHVGEGLAGPGRVEIPAASCAFMATNTLVGLVAALSPYESLPSWAARYFVLGLPPRALPLVGALLLLALSGAMLVASHLLLRKRWREAREGLALG